MVSSIFLIMDVSVIIVNYNTCKLLDNCLESIYRYTKDISFEIIVVDNASTDGSQQMIKSKYSWVKLIESNENLGFGRANNLGFKHSIGRNIFLLNSDTLLIDNSIKTLSDYLEKDNSIGAVGATLIDSDRKQIHSYGDFPTIFNKIVQKNFLHNAEDVKCVKYVDYITGADIMIPREVWLKLDGFDSNFFLYYEETDLQKRMTLLGYKRVLCPFTSIIHLEGASSKNSENYHKSNEWKKIVMFKSMMYYFKKHSSNIGFTCFRTVLLLKYSVSSLFVKNSSNYFNKLINLLKLNQF